MPFLSLLLSVLAFVLIPGLAAAQAPEQSPSPLPHLYSPEPVAQRLGAGDVFGVRSGYVHPFVSVGGFYTDNLFDSPDDRRSEFVTVLSPGLWVAVPGSRQPLLDIDTRNTAPGGLELTRFRSDPQRRFQGYGLYRADIRKHRNFPEEETTNHQLEGLLQGNLRGGLSLELLNVFTKNYESYGTGLDREALNTFESNLLRVSAAYPVTPRIRLEVDYGLFSIDYDRTASRFRERDDQTASAWLFYRFLPKTSVAVLYRYVDIDYALPVLPGSREHQVFGGLQWVPSDRSRARVLLGRGEKSFDGDLGSKSDFIAEARFELSVGPRTALNLRGTRQTNETDIPEVLDVLSHRVRLDLVQRLRERLSAGIELGYARERYRDALGPTGAFSGRRDNYYSAGVNLGFQFRRWANLSLGYSYLERQSNFGIFEYDSNNLYLNLTGAL